MSSWRDRIKDFLAVEEVEEEEYVEEPELEVSDEVRAVVKGARGESLESTLSRLEEHGLSIAEVGVNSRLVFEMHRFDVEAGEFVYHERWNQLWLNVTGTG